MTRDTLDSGIIDTSAIKLGSATYQPNQLMTIAQVCAEYGIGRTTLYGALNDGSLPARVVRTRGTRIRRADIDHWIANLPLYKAARPPPA